MADDGTAPKRANAKARILEWLEVLAKLLGASAVLVVALFANSLQSRLTGVSIQSQREQAESQLRASMFNSLISPIAGPPANPPNHREFFRWDHSCFRGNLPPIPPTDARFIT